MIQPASPRSRVAITLVLSVAALAAAPATAALFVVDSTADSVDATPGDGACADAGGACSLRAALMETNALAGADEITLPAGTYGLTIPAGGTDTDASGDLDIADAVTIQGAGADLTILDGNLQSRVLEVAAMSASFPVELRDLTVTRGKASEAELPFGGGGIKSQGQLTLRRVHVTANSTLVGNGGGVHTAANLLFVRDSAIDGNNSGTHRGGGIFVGSSGADIRNSSVSQNLGTAGGGVALGAGATLVVYDSTLSGNQATSSQGGAIEINGGSNTVNLFNCTLAGNSAALFGGGLFNNGGNTVLVGNSILADNTAGSQGPDCWAFYGQVNSQGYNLLESTSNCVFGGSGTGELTGVDPQLGPLADNGGFARSHLPAPTSPAVDAGNPAAPGNAPACAPLDQRGVARSRDGNGDATARCDIGAVELGRHDLGDAPDPDYPTLEANDGARHLMAGTLWLGARRDDDADGQPDAAAAGDDAALADDEDGVELPQLLTGESPTLSVTSTGVGVLDAWIDFDQDGVWMEGDERVATGVALAAGANAVAVDVPVDAALGSTFARFRVSTAGGLSPIGEAADGEVEDHLVRIEQLVFASAFESGFDGWDAVVP